jgi:hypothetical protein
LLDIEFAVGTHLLNAANIEEKLKKMQYLEE